MSQDKSRPSSLARTQVLPRGDRDAEAWAAAAPVPSPRRTRMEWSDEEGSGRLPGLREGAALGAASRVGWARHLLSGAR